MIDYSSPRLGVHPATSGAILGIDFGERRIGLAIAEAGGMSARSLSTLYRRAHDPRETAGIRDVVAREDVTELVIGIPLEPSGGEGPWARTIRRWGEELGLELGLPVSFRDERLSSFMAEQNIGPAKRGRSGGFAGPTRRAQHKARIDREAARIILQDELDDRRGVSPASQPW